jgi:sugar phosphate isomerase/epimerase
VVPIYGRTNKLPDCGTGRSPEEDERLWLDGLREATDHAERVGGTLVVEGINRYENSVSVTVADAVRWARAMESANVRAMGDVFHMNIEEPDMGAALVEAGEMLAYVHLADSQRLEPGQGHLDFAGVFAGLHRLGYDGWASMECNLSGDPERVLPAAVAFLRGHLERAAAAVGSA